MPQLGNGSVTFRKCSSSEWRKLNYASRAGNPKAPHLQNATWPGCKIRPPKSLQTGFPSIDNIPPTSVSLVLRRDLEGHSRK